MLVTSMGAARKIGRNEACPCGSGLKAKRCHARLGGPPDGTVVIFTGAYLNSDRGSWDGAPVPSIRVFFDAGAGDALHALRYLPWIAARAGVTTVVTRPTMTTLFRAAVPASIAVIDRHPVPAATAHATSLGILRRAGDRTLRELPRDPAAPYIVAPDPVAYPRGTRHIGICARGDATQAFDRWRSIHDPAVLAPLFALPGVAWHDLAAGPDTPWLTTANRVAGLDAVVAVDTGVAHLAGALGVPLHLLNRAGGPGDWGPDARWLEGYLQPGLLYRGMRLYQQADRDAGWGDVVEQVHAALKEGKTP